MIDNKNKYENILMQNNNSTQVPCKGITRRAALRGIGAGLIGAVGAGYLPKALASGGSGSAGAISWPGQNHKDPTIPIASKGRPMKLPIPSDNRAIPSNQSPEKGPLVIYDWSDYLSPEVVQSFEKRYGVKATVSNFASFNEAVNKVHSGAITADVWVSDPQRIVQLAQARLIQPINHDYIPNLSKVIPAARDPWFDQGARYTTPNFINTYGCGWRSDLIDIDPASLKNPWDVYWQVPRDTPIGMTNADEYEDICMALLRSGFTNFDQFKKEDIFSGMQALTEFKHLKLQYTAFQPLALGNQKLAYCYNGDMMQIGRYLPSGVSLSDVQFFFPEDGHGGVILNDMWTIPKNAKNPVLAHLFMNHFLEMESAIANFRDVGYQTMLEELTLDKLKAADVADPHTLEMVFSPPAYQENGLPIPVLTQEQLVWFAQAFQTLQTGTS